MRGSGARNTPTGSMAACRAGSRTRNKYTEVGTERSHSKKEPGGTQEPQGRKDKGAVCNCFVHLEHEKGCVKRKTASNEEDAVSPGTSTEDTIVQYVHGADVEYVPKAVAKKTPKKIVTHEIPSKTGT